MPTETYPRQGPPLVNLGGWSSLAAYPVTGGGFAGITFAGNLAQHLALGDRLMFQNVSLKYGYVIGFSFDGVETQIEIRLDAGVTIDSSQAITGVFLSHMATPAGFPEWFAWLPTITGFSVLPTQGVYRFRMTGRMVTVAIAQGVNGTSNSTTFGLTAPLDARVETAARWSGVATVVNNGAQQTTPGIVFISQTDVGLIALNTNFAGAGFTASGGKRVVTAGLTYEFSP